MAALPECDAIVAPAAVGAAPDTSTTGNPCFNAPWSYLGWHEVSFPIGLSSDGLPLALQLIHPRPDLLQTAIWCESILHSASVAGSR
jgi:aspartyl-tRNA(Asn)/glutamyl-tRNA(Gln) amidotransferase subunit A